MMGILIAFPWLPFVIAALFAAGWYARKSPALLAASICWAAYGVYEYMMQTAWCTGECNIRVDLLLFYPALAIVSALAIWRNFRT